ncbi:hypothetical protein Tco_0103669, partial [Tanacetum coccineum]
SDMPGLEIFNMPKQGIFDITSYDEEGVVTDFNNLLIKQSATTVRRSCTSKSAKKQSHRSTALFVCLLLISGGTKDEEVDAVDVTPKTSHLNVVKRIFKYLKGKPNLGLWYPRESSFDLEAFSDSDYVGANLDRKSTTGGCQFLGSRLISWQCKKQTIVATSTTEAEYVAAASCCGQVLWIQNQMLDYGFNFMNTKIHIDNESTICIVKNLVYHSKTKHIEIRHHFIRDSYEKKLIRVEKIHTDFNVADLLTKAFDGPRLYLDCIGAWIRVELKIVQMLILVDQI